VKNVSFMILLTILFCFASEKDWVVDSSRGPADTIDVTLDEGTWMNLDVSPDGGTIVFDLLGDIFVMPAKGGRATLLAGGMAWEVQPRFSPNGSEISFTSDRGGADNIWIMDADGGNKRQVTKEDFRLLNNAFWMPDGDYLVARKHFTSRRSLGAGEIWLYHKSGGSGVQLTKRKNDQQDVNEPAISPDGRYLYFSEDMYPGGYFQYNKNVHQRVYVVRRLDMQTGDLKNIISLNGGACRPQVSPDGKTIAFVRRVRDKSVLYLYDIASATTRPLYDKLSHDQQEAWAIFGTYPGFDWMPDGNSIVIWADGKIREIDAASGEAQVIPFELQTEKSIARALRYEQQVHSEAFTAKMIRHAATHPNGKEVVFNAVGNLWLKTLPDGAPEKLTPDNMRAFEAAYSPDGKWIVFAGWNDAELGHIYKMRSSGGSPQQLTKRPGYYHTPRFSPDGKRLTYQRDNGDRVLGYAHGNETGLYICDSDGNNHRRVVEQGWSPRFNMDGSRLYFMDSEGEKKVLRSVDLHGGEQRTHFSSTYSTDMVPSPDGRWLAFRELFQLYVVPFPNSAVTIDLSGGMKALPVKQVTRDAGRDVHWSADSKKLHWLLGAEYFTRGLNESFTFVEGAPDSLPAVDSSGVALGLTVKSDVPKGVVAFRNARIVTMDGDRVLENGTIIVEGNRIKALGPAAEVQVPEGAFVVDAAGKTIIPGIIDVHAHLANHWSGSGIFPNQDWSYLANLAYGVTTTHDPSTNTEMSFGQAEMVVAGKMVGPRIFSTGTILYGADGDFKAVINSLDDARSHLRRLKAVGAFSVKSYNQPRRNQRQQVIKAARELQMMVYPEGGSFFFHNMSMVADGHTGIEHNIPVQPIYDDVVKFWAASGTGYTPTLVVSYGSLSGEYYWYHHYNVWENERLLTFTPRSIIDARSIRREMAPENDYAHIGVAKQCKKLLDAGVKVNLGAHGQLQGLGAHWELWMLEQGGMTTMEALRCATINGAYYIGMEKELGSLEVGKLADLVVLDKNPLENIRNSDSVNMVMVNGRLYDAATMNEIGNNKRERAPLWWEMYPGADAFPWHEEAAGHCSCGR